MHADNVSDTDVPMVLSSTVADRDYRYKTEGVTPNEIETTALEHCPRPDAPM